MDKQLTIGALAKGAGVNVETVRYYERRKLLPVPERRPSGYRVYDVHTLRRVRFIKNAQVLGFTLAEIAELLDLQSGECRRNVQEKAEAKLIQVKTKLRDLKSLARELQRLIGSCKADRLTGGCPIIETLQKQERRQKHGNPKAPR